MNDRERENWVLNDEGMYQWWKRTGQSMRKFLRLNRKEIDQAIERATNRPPKGG